MIPDVFEELVWATIQERQEWAPEAVSCPRRRSGLPLRSRLARELVRAGLCLDHRAGEPAEGPAPERRW